MSKGNAPASSATAVEPGWTRVLDGFSRLTGTVAAIVVIVMMLHIIASVAARTLFGAPLPATLEFTVNWWMPLLTLMALGFAQLEGQHIHVTLLSDRMSARGQVLIQRASLAVTAAIVLYAAYYNALKAVESVEKSEMALGALWLPVWPVRVLVVVGLVGYALQLLVEFWRVGRGEPRQQQEEES